MPNASLGRDTPYYIVFNAASGSGDAHRARQEMVEVLDEAGRRYEFFPIDHPRRIEEIARQAVEAAVRNQGAVIAAGGDGTINAVIEQALPAGCPLGIVPRGTFNYSSRAHGIPSQIQPAVRSLLTARLKPVQVGSVNERVFLVNASLGLYPQLLQDREAMKEQYGRRRSIAFWAGIATLTRHRPQLSLQIEHDRQRELVRTPTLFVGNNPMQLEQVGLPEAEDVQRRRLAAVIVKPVSTAALVWLAARGALGQLGEDERIRDFAFKRMLVNPLGYGRGKIKVAIDGEICWMRTPLVFSVAPQSLMLMTPTEADVAS